MKFLDRLLGRKELPTPPLASASPEAPKPAIKVRLHGANMFTSAFRGEPVTGVVLHAAVWNTGAPSAIVRWRLEIIPLDAPFSCDLSEIPDTLTLDGPVRNVFRGSEALDKRLGVQMLGIAPFDGRLLFYTDLPQATVLAANTRLKLIVEDVYGNEYSTEQLIGAWNKGAQA